ncbi:hypothetical protein HZA97_01645 [Candidatus Woesearchaeota archaeon]|nr:hypothetical protein [Candidatus Woesearchaeota archaeon]
MKKIFFVLLIIFLIPVVYAGAYGAGAYGAGDYGVGEAAASPSTTSESRTTTETTTEDTGRFDPKSYLGFVANFIAPGSIAELSKTNKITKTVTAIKGSLDSVVLFRLNAQTHTVMLDKVDEQTKTVSFILASEPQFFSLKENEKMQFDLDGDLFAETEVSAGNTNYSKLSTDVSISWVENQTMITTVTKQESETPSTKKEITPGTELKISETKKTETITELKKEELKLQPKDFVSFKEFFESAKESLENVKTLFEKFTNKIFDEIKKHPEVNMLILEIASGVAVFVLVITFVLFKSHRKKRKERVQEI